MTNDMVPDTEDGFPLDGTESSDNDNDGIGDNADLDDDNDMVPDTEDAFPFNRTESSDNDNDGIGDNADADDDNDLVADTEDAFPLNRTESSDNDNDGIGDNADADDDNDMVADTEDAFPLNRTESSDNDNDGIGDNADADDDNDMVADTEDAFPLDGTESSDNDNDGIGDNADADDDNDLVPDTEDAFPLDGTETSDNDGDAIGDNADLDDDNDGLIELRTAEMLHNVRHQLNGTGYRESEEASISGLGCGGDCEGYELMTNISLAAWNWQPIGDEGCEVRHSSFGPVVAFIEESFFTAIFEGNGNWITDLSIVRPTERCVGLFAAAGAGAVIRNLNLVGGEVIGNLYVGGMVGYGSQVRINASSVALNLRGNDYVGGLIGVGIESLISLSSVQTANISGTGNVGGIMGYGSQASIISSRAQIDNVGGNLWVGGLVGYGYQSRIVSSYAQTGGVSGSSGIGGLAGYWQEKGIISSYAQSDRVSGSSRIGGLVGSGVGISITSSYAQAHNLSGDSYVGGLVGLEQNVNFNSSYWNSLTEITAGTDIDAYKTTLELGSMGAADFEISSVPLSIWCDLDFNGEIGSEERTDDNRLWDFGGFYPAITCAPSGVAAQQAWLVLNRGALIDPDADGVGAADNCPVVFNPYQEDRDNDGYGDACDPDDDGDGLIELWNAEMFNNVRHQLDGSGYRASATDTVNRIGCGGQEGINDCNGYELMEDISLANWTSGSGWQPIGSDGCYETSAGKPGFREEFYFDAIFEGNGHWITDLSIVRPTERCVGLFAVLNPGASIRNVNLAGGDIRGKFYVGGLVGYSLGARISSSSVRMNSVIGSHSYVGGLIGNGRNARITFSNAWIGRVRGASVVGGLVGGDQSVYVAFSSARVGDIGGSGVIGGLIGSAKWSQIFSSFAEARSINGTGNEVGGLVGNGFDANVVSSYALVESVAGEDSVGGLIGSGRYADIMSSYVYAIFLEGNRYVGGLAGDGKEAQITSSYTQLGNVNGMSHFGGLVGLGLNADANSSYWSSLTSIEGGSDIGIHKTITELRDLDAPDLELSSFPSSIWCDINANGEVEPEERTDKNKLWDFGADYPAIRCIPASVSLQREWVGGINLTTIFDPDSDGILLTDNCPAMFNPAQEDFDNDGYGDLCDADDDGDEVADIVDNCLLHSNALQLDSDMDRQGDACDADDDDDGLEDLVDLDIDGDGLIELWTAEMLNNVRYVLNGTGYRESEEDPIDSSGCGEGCNGYELTADISLANWTSGSGWQPIAHASCEEMSSPQSLDGLSFTAIFEGNGNWIRDLEMDRSTESCVGLFASLKAGAIVRNISIEVGDIVGSGYVGGLVGIALNATITSSFIEGNAVRGSDSVGGLVGYQNGATIASSAVQLDSVEGNLSIGGLVGAGYAMRIVSSYAQVYFVTGGMGHIGGLVGFGRQFNITSSYAWIQSIAAIETAAAGGLVGYGWGGRIISSYAQTGQVRSHNGTGGLVGTGLDLSIISSYAQAGNLDGNAIGGLVGYIEDNVNAILSYWNNQEGIERGTDIGNYKTDAELGSLNSDDFDVPSIPSSVWCDGDFSGEIEDEERVDGNRVWGFAPYHPVIRCVPNGVEPQQEPLRF